MPWKFGDLLATAVCGNAFNFNYHWLAHTCVTTYLELYFLVLWISSVKLTKFEALDGLKIGRKLLACTKEYERHFFNSPSGWWKTLAIAKKNAILCCMTQ
jgi:hypothetical protein